MLKAVRRNGSAVCLRFSKPVSIHLGYTSRAVFNNEKLRIRAAVLDAEGKTVPALLPVNFKIHLPDGKDFTVEARGLGGKRRHVASVTLDGRPLDGCILRHEDILRGGNLTFTMSE